MENANSISILEQLENRLKDRHGELWEWECAPNVKKTIVGKVFIQPLTASELDDCLCLAQFYLEDKKRVFKLENENIEELRQDAIASAALAYAIRDEFTKERIFKTDYAIREIRKYLTSDEIFYLSRILDYTTANFATQQSLTNSQHLDLAAKIQQANGDLKAIATLHEQELIRMIGSLSLELEKLKKENEELKNKCKK